MDLNNKKSEIILKDKSEIDELVKRFFNLFCVEKNQKANLNDIYNLFVPEANIIKNVGTTLEIYNLQQFIEPRQKMFDNGILVDFKEKEVWEKTDIFGNIAQRICIYEKSGISNGVYSEGRGMKTMQFTRTPVGWRMVSGVWDDERQGLCVGDAYIDEKQM